ncbi:MAG: hypothetical protein NT086_21690, partial [Proteobacteria bacterium]|nr:hypothetical protein [Pseudomonadota bacterium]
MASLRAGRFFETLISSLKIKPLIELENHSSVRASFSALADILLDSKLSSRSRAIQGELVEESNVQKMHIANSDKPIKLYNLD